MTTGNYRMRKAIQILIKDDKIVLWTDEKLEGVNCPVMPLNVTIAQYKATLASLKNSVPKQQWGRG